MEQQEKKTRNNKKWFVVVAMLLLLIAILALGGYTFARYISSTTLPTQQATVAKWGFVVNANADKLFSGEYSQGNVKTSETTTGVDVKASTTNADGDLVNIVAPGTKGSMTFGVTGTAEVLAQIKATMTNVKEISLTNGKDSSVYRPVKWTLHDGSNNVVTDGTLADVATKINAIAKTVDPGDAASVSYTLSWKWDLGTSEDATDANNIKDTLLGYAAQGVKDGETEASYENGRYKVTVAGDTVTITDNLGDEDATNDVTYTAAIKVAFDFSIGIMQIQSADSAA